MARSGRARTLDGKTAYLNLIGKCSNGIPDTLPRHPPRHQCHPFRIGGGIQFRPGRAAANWHLQLAVSWNGLFGYELRCPVSEARWFLLDADFGGRPRKLLLFANRNGFYYIFDRVTGEYLHAKAFARQTWAKGLDANGRPIPNPDTVPSSQGALVYPDDDGVTNWFSPSYSPQTKTFYQNVREKGGIYYRNDAVYQPGRMYLGASKRAVRGEEPWGALRALDPLTGDVKWEFRVTTPPWCGLLSTGGGLVFSGTMEGMFFALDAESGKPLWQFQTGGAIWSNPISYQAGGHQFVAIAAGSALVVFGLAGS